MRKPRATKQEMQERKDHQEIKTIERRMEEAKQRNDQATYDYLDNLRTRKIEAYNNKYKEF